MYTLIPCSSPNLPFNHKLQIDICFFSHSVKGSALQNTRSCRGNDKILCCHTCVLRHPPCSSNTTERKEGKEEISPEKLQGSAETVRFEAGEKGTFPGPFCLLACSFSTIITCIFKMSRSCACGSRSRLPRTINLDLGVPRCCSTSVIVETARMRWSRPK